MSIRTIEVICVPCQKCEKVMRAITEAVKHIEIENKVKIVYDFKHTTSFIGLDRYSVNAAQAPIVVINGVVECTGQVEAPVLRKKLTFLFSQ